MEENMNFNFDTIMDKISTNLEEIIEGTLVDQIDNAVACAVQNLFPEALNESLSDFEFVLTDGTIVRPRQHMKLLSPDKSKLVICYGGLRVDDCALMVQTRISCWENIAIYQSREEAIDALAKVKNAMESNLSVFEL